MIQSFLTNWYFQRYVILHILTFLVHFGSKHTLGTLKINILWRDQKSSYGKTLGNIPFCPIFGYKQEIYTLLVNLGIYSFLWNTCLLEDFFSCLASQHYIPILERYIDYQTFRTVKCRNHYSSTYGTEVEKISPAN